MSKIGIEKNPADFLSSDVEAVVASERNYATRYNRQSEPRAILLAGQPETNCQGLFHQIHKKSTKKVPEALYGS